MLVIKYGIVPANTCKAFNIVDLTGTYNASTNPSGYGTPNRDTGDFNEATFTVVGGLINATVNVWNTLPTKNDEILFPITNSDLGLDTDENIPSEIYLGTYTITSTVGDIPFTDSHYWFADCMAQCCADAKMAKAIKDAPAGCLCDEKAMNDALYLQGLIKAVHAALSDSCNELLKAQTLVDEINKICANCQCGCN